MRMESLEKRCMSKSHICVRAGRVGHGDDYFASGNRAPEQWKGLNC